MWCGEEKEEEMVREHTLGGRRVFVEVGRHGEKQQTTEDGGSGRAKAPGGLSRVDPLQVAAGCQLVVVPNEQAGHLPACLPEALHMVSTSQGSSSRCAWPIAARHSPARDVTLLSGCQQEE